MARNVVIQLEDDLDGGPPDETLTFALDGRRHEIDLSTTSTEKLRDALRPFVAVSRKAPAGAGGRRKRTTGTTASSSETARRRTWAKEHGHQVSERGRIQHSIKVAYYAATVQCLRHWVLSARHGGPTWRSLAPRPPARSTGLLLLTGHRRGIIVACQGRTRVITNEPPSALPSAATGRTRFRGGG
jgi:hypothetical protein